MNPPTQWQRGFTGLENCFARRANGKWAELFEYLPDTWACAFDGKYESDLDYETALNVVNGWIEGRDYLEEIKDPYTFSVTTCSIEQN